MRVLLVSSKYLPEYSGSGFRAHNLYKRLSIKFNIEYDVVCNSLINKKNETYNYDGTKVYKISYPIEIEKLYGFKKKLHIILSMIYEFYYSYKFVKKKKIKNYDLIHTFGNSWSIAFLTYYFFLKKKPIIRELVNNMKTPYYPIQFENFFKRIFQKDKTLMIAISKKLEELCKIYRVKNIWFRPNPIDEKKFFFITNTEKAKLRNKLTNFSNNDIVLAHIASYMTQKNHIFLLGVLKKLPKNYKLYLGGTAQNAEQELNFKKVQEKINQLDLKDRVILTKKFIENFDEYIKLSDVFLFPTWNEALGTPILEAQACGVPIVANSMQGSTNYWINDREGGFLVEKFDEKLWAEKIKLALNIEKEVLRQNSFKITNIASTKNIDLEYFKRMKTIT
jgi:glycosyltransferase involved in cell wall biosynthesis